MVWVAGGTVITVWVGCGITIDVTIVVVGVTTAVVVAVVEGTALATKKLPTVDQSPSVGVRALTLQK